MKKTQIGENLKENIMKSRIEIIKIILGLNSFMIDQMNLRFKTTTSKHPELTLSWLEEKFDRFHLVESTSHREEDFTVNVEVRYTLRSQEAEKYGSGHNAFYKRYLSTITVPLSAIEDPEGYMLECKEEFAKHNKQEA